LEGGANLGPDPCVRASTQVDAVTCPNVAAR